MSDFDRDTDSLLLESVLGSSFAAAWHAKLHDLHQHGAVEFLWVAPENLKRRRFRGRTDAGTECAVSLPRDATLADGDILFHVGHRAIVLRVGEQDWIAVRPNGPAAALELGYLAGNLHWRVRFEDGLLMIAAEGPRADYLNRLARLIETGGIHVEE